MIPPPSLSLLCPHSPAVVPNKFPWVELRYKTPANTRTQRIGTPIFCKPLAELFNLSIATSAVPSQWKEAYIKPVPNVAHPKVISDFWPVLIAPVLTRIMEQLIVQQFLYPAIKSSSTAAQFSDQYAFWPNGSPTAAIISILQTVTHLSLTAYMLLSSL